MTARVHPVADEGLGNTSYVVEVARGLAVCVDPPRDVGAHLGIAERAGARIAAVLETHVHADFVTGSPEVAEVTGAAVHVSAAARVKFPHVPVRPDDVLRIGDVSFRVLGTPGHTAEHLAFVLEEEGRPRAVFSGGSLIAGGAARTDLSGDALVEPLTRAQFRSIRAIAALPDDVSLHPTHGVGSFCSSGPGGRVPRTIGDERRHNELLRTDDEDTFVDTLLSGLGSFPTYFLHLPRVNRAGPGLLRSLEEPAPLASGEVARAVASGAWLIDGRPVSEWAAGHPRGALSIALRPQFSSWLGWIVPFGDPIVLVVGEERLDEAVRLARQIGYDRLLGWLDGGVEVWRAAGLPTARLEVVTAEEARARARDGAKLLDVRQRSEWVRSRIPVALHVELGDIIGGKRPAGELITFCSHGERSATAASILLRDGARVANLAGGLSAWERAGLPIER